MVKVAIIGAAGYTGAELTRLVSEHPEMELVAVTSAAEAGKSVAELYPALAGVGLRYEKPDVEAIADAAGLAFLAVPHTAAMAIAPRLLEAGVRVVDLSADFRLKDAEVYEEWYGVQHAAPGLLGEAVYGLPELSREGLGTARLVACAGCYPTASVIAAVPALSSGVAEPGVVIVDAKSGVSGAGRSLSAGSHFVAANESMAPYKVASHRHTPEIEASLDDAAGGRVRLTFTPHLAPMTRGLLATVYMRAADGVTHSDLHGAYDSRYGEEPFVTVHRRGVMPSTREVTGSNRAHVGLALDERSGMIIAACAIDNLIKGASGQALQCANAMLGHPETLGLGSAGTVV